MNDAIGKKHITMREFRDIVRQYAPEDMCDTFIPDQVLGHALELINNVCAYDDATSTQLRWQIYPMLMRAQCDDSIKYTCEIVEEFVVPIGKPLLQAFYGGKGETIQHAIMRAVGDLLGYCVE